MVRCGAVRAATAALLATAGAAQAFPVDAGPEWTLNLDNTVLYNLGVRARNIDPRIGNSPTMAESDYRFPDRGDIVTNRVALLTEFDAVYQDRMGLRLTAAAWKDFAYDSKPRTNPGYLVAPGTPGPFVATGRPYPTNYNNGEYSSYTRRYQIEGAELLDAFAFARFDLGGRPSTLRIGKLTQFWGNALFFGAAGVNYSQSASDLIKQATAPGTQAKELAIPRGQVNFSTQLTDELQIGAQYFLEFERDRMVSGGTYLGAADFLFEGPDKFGLANATRLTSAMPANRNDNFGVQARWSPAWLGGSFGFYYRQFDETRAWGPIFRYGAGPLPTGYRLSYPTGVKMLAVSLDKQLGIASAGLELSYRNNTGLNTNGQVRSAVDTDQTQGARGNTLNLVANAMVTLTPTPLYDTGTAMVELAVVHLLKVTDQEARYNGVGTAACGATGGRYTGCSTGTAAIIAGRVEPQWLQALPGWDLSAPLFVMLGLKGNAASNGIPVLQGDLQYALGLKAALNQRYNFTLQYNGYHGRGTGITNAGAALGVPNGTPGYAHYYAGGNRMYQYNDRNWLSFTFSTTF
jgi:hypothetical protein